MKTLIILFTIAAGILCNSCAKIPVLGREELNLIPENQVDALAFSEYKNFLAANPVITNTPEAAMVVRVGQRLSTAVENFLKDNGYADRAKEFNWEYHLVL